MARYVPHRAPRFTPSPKCITDGCSENAARAQAQRINDLWASMGRRANARAVVVGQEDSRFAIWGIRSDIVNGVAR